MPESPMLTIPAKTVYTDPEAGAHGGACQPAFELNIVDGCLCVPRHPRNLAGTGPTDGNVAGVLHLQLRPPVNAGRRSVRRMEQGGCGFPPRRRPQTAHLTWAAGRSSRAGKSAPRVLVQRSGSADMIGVGPAKAVRGGADSAHEVY